MKILALESSATAASRAGWLVVVNNSPTRIDKGQTQKKTIKNFCNKNLKTIFSIFKKQKRKTKK